MSQTQVSDQSRKQFKWERGWGSNQQSSTQKHSKNAWGYPNHFDTYKERTVKQKYETWPWGKTISTSTTKKKEEVELTTKLIVNDKAENVKTIKIEKKVEVELAAKAHVNTN